MCVIKVVGDVFDQLVINILEGEIVNNIPKEWIQILTPFIKL